MFTYDLSDLLLGAVCSLVVFVLLEYILEVHVPCIYKGFSGARVFVYYLQL
jgi:hypothetical protein